jgi:hypothetical protein
LESVLTPVVGQLHIDDSDPCNKDNCMFTLLMRSGDIASARLLFKRLANADIADAAPALAATYDPRYLAQHKRVKIHDLVLEGIDAALRRRGYPSVESLKPAFAR